MGKCDPTGDVLQHQLHNNLLTSSFQDTAGSFHRHVTSSLLLFDIQRVRHVSVRQMFYRILKLACGHKMKRPAVLLAVSAT